MSVVGKIKRFFYKRRLASYEVGKHTYWSGKPLVFSWGDNTTLKVGAFCSIAKGVQIYLGGEHRMDWVTSYPLVRIWEECRKIKNYRKSKGDVTIGNDVWIGREAVIMSGVTVGDGAVIGARAVVSRDVPAYSIVTGNPGQIVRSRFDERIIKRLIEIKWWKWNDDRIKKAIPLLLSDDIEVFIEAAEKGEI